MIKKTQKRNNKPTSSRPIICWDCSQFEHTRGQCKLRKIIKELNIPEDEKDNLLSLLEDLSDTSE